MDDREILNRAEGIIINAKSLAAGGQWPEVRDQMENLHNLMHQENRPQAEQPAEPAKQPSADHVSAEDAVKAEAERSEPEKPAESAAEPESKDDAGVVSEPAEQKGKDGAGVVSDPGKSQTKPDSGVV